VNRALKTAPSSTPLKAALQEHCPETPCLRHSSAMVKKKDKKPYHQDTKDTKFHQEKQDVNFVFLGELGVLVVKHWTLTG
jgi:hypothetical protein